MAKSALRPRTAPQGTQRRQRPSHITSRTKSNPSTKPKPENAKLKWVGVLVAVLLGTVAWYTLGPNEIDLPELVEATSFSPYEIDTNPALLPDPIEVLKERYTITVLSKDPIVYQFEDFLTLDECEALKNLGKEAGLARSTAGLSRTVDNVRTSSTAWLTAPELAHSKAVTTVEKKIAEAMNVPQDNMEHFQILNYQVGQFYKAHHDYIPEQHPTVTGPRLATFFVYLNDVEEGGGTDFPTLGFTAIPKKGRAVLWYNTWYNNHTDQKEWRHFSQEHRTTHEAMPVIKGEKWAANKWVHTGDFVTNWAIGATL